MKIWKTTLNMQMDFDYDYKLFFDCGSDGKDYKENKKYNEWTRSDGWLITTIPMGMECDKTYGYKIQQGFDYEPNDYQLREIKTEMINYLQKVLHMEKKEYLDEYNKKIKLLADNIVEVEH